MQLEGLSWWQQLNYSVRACVRTCSGLLSSCTTVASLYGPYGWQASALDSMCAQMHKKGCNGWGNDGSAG